MYSHGHASINSLVQFRYRVLLSSTRSKREEVFPVASYQDLFPAPLPDTMIVISLHNRVRLAAGEYIAVERVENVYKQCEIIEQLWVYGNSFESCLVAVVVPREQQLRAAAHQAGVAGAQTSTLQVGGGGCLLTDLRLRVV